MLIVLQEEMPFANLQHGDLFFHRRQLFAKQEEADLALGLPQGTVYSFTPDTPVIKFCFSYDPSSRQHRTACQCSGVSAPPAA